MEIKSCHVNVQGIQSETLTQISWQTSTIKLRIFTTKKKNNNIVGQNILFSHKHFIHSRHLLCCSLLLYLACNNHYPLLVYQGFQRQFRHKEFHHGHHPVWDFHLYSMVSWNIYCTCIILEIFYQSLLKQCSSLTINFPQQLRLTGNHLNK